MAQIQANVAVFQETQTWKKDGIAEEIGWRQFRAENGEKGDAGGEKGGCWDFFDVPE